MNNQFPGQTPDVPEERPTGAVPPQPERAPMLPPLPSISAADAAATPGATGPTQPLGVGFGLSTQPATAQVQWATPEKKRTGSAGRVAAVFLVAALIGGAAGFGGSWAQRVLTPANDSATTTTASSPSNITVNNPGSVNEATAIAAKDLPSVVTINVTGTSAAGSGSGVIINADGYILTNTHVVTLGGAASNATVKVTLSDGRIFDATVVGTDPTYDLAVIKVDGATDLSPIEFGDSSTLNVGDTAVAIGAPLGLSNTVTTGIVSALNRSISIASAAAPEQDSGNSGGDSGNGQDGSDSPFYFDIPGQTQQNTQSSSISIAVIQTDAAINPGNSGGALLNSEGKLIGINVAIATAGSSNGSSESGSIGVGFAIPVNVAKRVAQEIIDTGSATHGLLGASVQDAASVDNATVAGAYIADVTAGGAAAAAGLQQGDVVTAFDGATVSDATDLTAQVRALAGGASATLTYVRDGESSDVTVTLGTLQ